MWQELGIDLAQHDLLLNAWAQSILKCFSLRRTDPTWDFLISCQ